MSENKEAVVLKISDIERLEFTGTRNDDGSINAMGKRLPNWLGRLVVGEVKFRLEETDDRGAAESHQTQAWYVPE